ncbi:hypothetical protein Ancab_026773 [Ancistrocladus abbreviatus]
MNYSQNSEGPAVLQLHRWDHSRIQLDLSDFHEAFISPTRELLLLLSYNFEALLLPLVQVLSTLESATTVSGNGCSVECGASHSNDHPFVSDVSSLAWGVCGDTYNLHNEAPFRELLFVFGGRGVTVHAFRFDGNDEVLESSTEGEGGDGEWVEWGPASTSPCDIEAQGGGTISGTDGVEESPCSWGETSDSSPKIPTSKKWLRSFLTTVQTRECNGITRTLFPEKSVYPCSTKIVSFSLFNEDSSFPGFLSCANSILCEGVGKQGTGYESIHDSHKTAELNNLDIKSDGSVTNSNSYKCCRVFSSNSYHFVGFIFTSVDTALSNGCNISDNSNSWKKIVLVARLDFCGILWLCSVKLEPTTMSRMAEWSDFQFSESFLLCLNASGLIFFYGTMTGEYVACLDISTIYGGRPQKQVQNQEKLLVDRDLIQMICPVQDKQNCDDRSALQNHDIVHMRKFRRLIVASHTSLLAVVDEFGIVYVTCSSHLVPEKHYPFEKWLPQYSSLGILAPWEVGYSDISCQRVSLAFSGCQGEDHSFTRRKKLSLSNDFGNEELQTVETWSLQGMVNQEDFNLSGFLDVSRKNIEGFTRFRSRRFMRNFFLPITKASADDTICFSSFGVTRLIRMRSKGRKNYHIIHSNLHMNSTCCDDGRLNSRHQTSGLHIKQEALVGEAIGCIFQGCLYLVTRDGLSVVLPSISVSSDFHPVESIGYHTSKINQQTIHQVGDNLKKWRQLWPPWKVEILDRVLLYEGPDEADCLCLENGWDVKVSRLRRLQLALSYLKFDEMEQSLAMLVGVNMAEEGMLRLIFAAVYMIFHRIGNDNEVSAALRILALATRFAIKMIREYAILDHSRNGCSVDGMGRMEICASLTMLPYKEQDKVGYSRRMEEMAHYLEITRNLQCRLAAKRGRLGQALVAIGETQNFAETNVLLDDSQTSMNAYAMSPDRLKEPEPTSSSLELDYNTAEKLALIPIGSSGSVDKLNSEIKHEVSLVVPEVPRRAFPTENPKEMIARWEIDNLDLKNVVKDALLSGRLPLAVLQLHLHRLKDLIKDKEQNDTFTEVRDVGRAIAYDLFLKGETGLAVATLQKLGEDIETCLRQLLFGTISRSLRCQITVEMKKYGFLRSYELTILERISLIERMYTSSSFWGTYLFWKKEVMGTNADIREENSLRLLHPHSFRELIIECGEVDGVVLGSWTNFSGSSISSEPDEDSSYARYWAAAAVWSSAWDQKTVDRVSRILCDFIDEGIFLAH